MMQDKNTEKRWSPAEFAALVGVSVRTLKRWHDSGKLVAGSYPSGRRFYTQAHYEECLSVSGSEGGGSDEP